MWIQSLSFADNTPVVPGGPFFQAVLSPAPNKGSSTALQKYRDDTPEPLVASRVEPPDSSGAAARQECRGSSSKRGIHEHCHSRTTCETRSRSACPGEPIHKRSRSPSATRPQLPEETLASSHFRAGYSLHEQEIVAALAWIHRGLPVRSCMEPWPVSSNPYPGVGRRTIIGRLRATRPESASSVEEMPTLRRAAVCYRGLTPHPMPGMGRPFARVRAKRVDPRMRSEVL